MKVASLVLEEEKKISGFQSCWLSKIENPWQVIESWLDRVWGKMSVGVKMMDADTVLI